MQIILSSAKLMNATTSVHLNEVTEPLFHPPQDQGRGRRLLHLYQ